MIKRVPSEMGIYPLVASILLPLALGAALFLYVRLRKALRAGAETAAPSESSGCDAVSGARVLVVDDAATNLMMAQGMLERYNIQADMCDNGEEAIERVRDCRYDLVFMDHLMPVMDGVETTERIRAMGAEDRYFADVPIIALTANAAPGLKEMFLSHGFNDFLEKPIEAARLKYILTNWIPREVRRRIDGATAELAATHVPEHNIPRIMKDAGIDYDKGLAIAGGDFWQYIKTLTAFHADANEKKHKIVECMASGNLQLYAIYAHGFRSAATVIGAAALSKAAADLETAGKHGNDGFIKDNNGKFLNMLQSVTDCLAAVLDITRKDAESGLPELGLDTIAEGLTALKKAIVSLDMNIVYTTIETLLESARGNKLRAGIEAIADSVLTGNYDEAEAQIDSLILECE